MPSISLPTLALISAGATIVGVGLSVYESHQAGLAAAAMDRKKARVEADAATGKQITMRQNMLRALASQNAASLGAIGTGGASSFGANVHRQLTENQNDLMISRANSSAQTSLLEDAAGNAIAEGNAQAAGTLIGGIGTLSGMRSSARKP